MITGHPSLKKNNTATNKEWSEKFGSETEVSYLEENGMLNIDSECKPCTSN